MTSFNLCQQQMVQIARDQGFVTIDDLAERLSVTPQTVRRDINFRCDQGVLSRFHGGAAFRSSVVNLPYEARLGSMATEKAALAARVAAEIPDRSSVFIDIGTTAEAVAAALATKTGLRIVTNNLNVVTLLRQNDTFEITTVCGALRHRDLAVTGALATAFIEKFRVDFSILGVVAIDEAGFILDFHADEEPLTQAIIQCGRRSFAVADRTKFGRQAMARVARLSQLGALFTDAVPAGPWSEVVAEAGLEVILSQ